MRSLFLLSVLWAGVLQGVLAQSSCYLSQSDYAFYLGSDVMIAPFCSVDIASASIAPGTPPEMTFTAETGLIGSPKYALTKTSLTISVTTIDGVSFSLPFTLTLEKLPTVCQYNPDGVLRFPLLHPHNYTLTCDQPVSSITADALPKGLKLLPSGTLTGMIAEVVNVAVTLTVNSTRTTDGFSFSIRVVTIAADQLVTGVYLRISPENVWTTWMYESDPELVKNSFENRGWYVTNTIAAPYFQCKTGGCANTLGRMDWVYVDIRFLFNFDKVGTYSFDINADDNVAFFMDTNDYHAVLATGWQIHQFYDVVITDPGWRYLRFIFNNRGADKTELGNYPKIKAPGSASYVDMSSAFSYRSFPDTLICTKTYNQVYTLFAGQTFTIAAPVCTGASATWSAAGLPAGFTMTPSSGAISGTAGASASRETVTVTTNGIVPLKMQFQMAVVNPETDLPNGLRAKYYSLEMSSCAIPTSVPEANLQFSRLDSQINFPVQYSAWPGLNYKFGENYYIRWTGYLRVAEPKTYFFRVAAKDGFRLSLGSQAVLINNICGVIEMEASFDVPTTLTRITVEYWANTINTGIILSWKDSDAAEFTVIPASAFLSMPETLFSYRIQKADYPFGVALPPNIPLWIGDSEGYFYSVSPSLPAGVSFDSNTGAISGTIREAPQYSFPYVVTATAEGKPTFTATILLATHFYYFSDRLSYPALVGSIGVAIAPLEPSHSTISDPIFSSPNLPSGLVLDPTTGVISGTPAVAFDGQFIVNVANLFGSLNANVSSRLEGCGDKNRVFLKIHISDAQVSIALRSGDFVHFSQSSFQPSTDFAVALCLSDVSFSVEIVSMASSAGYVEALTPSDNMIMHYVWPNGESRTTVSYDLSENLAPVLEYPPASPLVHERFSLCPMAKYGASGFQIKAGQEPLPATVAFDPRTGCISGYLGSASQVTRVVVATNSHGSGEASAVISPKACLGFQRNILFEVVAGSSSQQMRFTFTADGVKIFDLNSFAVGTTFLGKCVSGDMEVGFGTRGNAAWASGEKIVPFIDGIAQAELVHSGGALVTRPLTNTFFISPTTLWESSTVFSDDWFNETNANLPPESQWPSYSAGSFPARTTVTTYYRSLTRPFLPKNFLYLTATIRTDGGVVGYYNGVEFFRHELPLLGNVDPGMRPMESLDAETLTVNFLPSSIAQSDIIAFEVHRSATSAGSDPFSVTLLVTTAASQIVTLTSLAVSAESSIPKTGNEGFQAVYDSNVNSKYLAGDTSGTKIRMVWRFAKNVYYPMNRDFVVNGNDCPSRDPKSWFIYGFPQGDDTNAILHTMEDGQIPGTVGSGAQSGRVPEYTYHLFNNSLSVNGYGIHLDTMKMLNHATCGSSFQAAEMQMQYVRPAQMCDAADGFPVALPGSTGYRACVLPFEGQVARPCSSAGVYGDIDESGCKRMESISSITYPVSSLTLFQGQSMAPMIPVMVGYFSSVRALESLPAGMHLDAKTGVLSGTPQIVSSLTRVEIVASDGPANASTSVTFVVLSVACPATGPYPTGALGDKIYLNCPSSMSGYATVSCEFHNGPYWTQDTRACVPGANPGCTLANASYELRVGEAPEDIPITCVDSVSSFTISPDLPADLVLTQAGRISGLLKSPIPTTLYTVNASGTGGYSILFVMLSAWKVPMRCSLGTEDNAVSFSLAGMQTTDRIQCDTTVSTFQVESGALPDGLMLHPSLGYLYGSPKAVTNGGVSVGIVASNPAGRVSLRIQVTVSSAIVALARLFGCTSPSGSYLSAPQPSEVWDKLSTGGIACESDMGPTSFSNFQGSASGHNIGPNVRRTTNYISKLTGSLNVMRAGTYVLRIRSDGRFWLYLDDMMSPLLTSTTPNNYAQINATLTVGTHALGFLYYHGTGNALLRFRWYSEDGGVSTDIITEATEGLGRFVPDEFMTHSNRPVQFLRYPLTTNYLVTSASLRLVPTFSGVATTWEIVPSELPEGLLFVNGTISGSSMSPVPNVDFTVRASNSHSSTSTTVSITIVSQTVNNMMSGLMAEYYSGSNLNCLVEPMLSSLKLETKRIDTVLQHAPMTDFWPELSPAFLDDYVVMWSGYVSIFAPAVYRFEVEADDSAIVSVNGVAFSTLQCGPSTAMSTEIALDVGLYPITIKYWKTHSSLLRGMRLLWSIGGARVTEIPEESFYTFPSEYFNYPYQMMQLLYNRPITSMRPLFAGVASSLYTSFTVDPALPGGLSLGASTGVITGTPTLSGSHEMVYTFTASGTNIPSLTTQISIAVLRTLPPQGLSYPDITFSIGTEVQITPMITNGERAIFSASRPLPDGLAMNTYTGEITGRTRVQYSDTIVFSAKTVAGTATVNSLVTVNPCEGGKVFLSLLYNVTDGVMLIVLKNRHDVSIYSRAAHPQHRAFQFEDCADTGTYSLQITTDSSLGPSFAFYQDSELLTARHLPDLERSALTLSLDVQQVSAVPTLTYDTASLRYQEWNTVSPLAIQGCQNFTIESGRLVEGLKLDRLTGIIEGIPAELTVPTAEISCSNRYGKGVVTYHPSIVIACKEPSIPIRLAVSVGQEGIVSSMSLTSVGTGKVYRFSSLRQSNRTLCMTTGSYKLDWSAASDWPAQSGVEIFYGASLLFSKKSITAGSSIETVLITDHVSPSSFWYVSSVYSAGWFTGLGVEDSMWQRHQTGSFPIRKEITTYYKTAFQFREDVSAISGLDVTVRFDAGIIVYINGYKVYQRNLPSGPVSGMTTATSTRDPTMPAFFRVTQEMLVNGINYVGVEVHLHSSSLITEPMSLTILPVSGSSQCTRQTLLSSAVPTMITDPPLNNSNVGMMIDGNIHTKFEQNINDPKVDYPRSFYFTFPENKEYAFSSYVLVTANDCPLRDPNSWNIYTSRLDRPSEWSLASAVPNAAMEGAAGDLSGAGRLKPNTFPLEKRADSFLPYSAYEFELLGQKGFNENSVCGKSVQFAELYVQQCRPRTCATSGEWKAAHEGKFSIRMCAAGALGYQMRECLSNGTFGVVVDLCGAAPSTMTMSAMETFVSLPAYQRPQSDGYLDLFSLDCELYDGLHFDPSQGTIFGTPIATEDSSKSCVMRAKASSAVEGMPDQYTSFTLSVTVLTCPADGDYRMTPIGQTATKPCDQGRKGLVTRKCNLANPAVWANPDEGACYYEPPIVKYPTFGFSGIVGTPIEDYVPVITNSDPNGVVVGLGPDFPPGLSITNDGRITGTPTTASGPSNYMALFTNRGGQTVVSVRVAIRAGELRSITYSPNAITVYRNVVSASSPPTIDGAFNGFHSTPPLPSGLVFNPITGAFEGAVSISETPRTISIEVMPINPLYPDIKTTVSLTIASTLCPVVAGFNSIEAGLVQNATCAVGYSGARMRLCRAENPAVWATEITDTCRISYPASYRYESDAIFFAVGVELSYQPILVGNLAATKFSVISGTLPPGIELTEKGVLTGTASQVTPSVRVTLGAEDETLRTAVITVEVVKNSCPEETMEGLHFGETPKGGLAESVCRDAMQGSVYRRCSFVVPPTWGLPDESQCYYNAPTYVRYKSVSFYVGFYDTAEPTYDQKPNFYEFVNTVEHPVPHGLTLNPETGVIYGVPTTAGESTVEVVGSNERGAAPSTLVPISISLAYCEADAELGYSRTQAGQVATKPCLLSSQKGSRSRTCLFTAKYPPQWSAETSSCFESPPEFDYESLYVCYSGIPIVRIQPSGVSYAPTHWSLDPIEPKGLVWDQLSGKLTGTTSFDTAQNVTYEVLARNDASPASTRRSFMISYKIAYCPAVDQWEATAYTKTSQALCGERRTGLITRVCSHYSFSLNVYTGVWDNAVDTSCSDFSAFEKPLKGRLVTNFSMVFPTLKYADVGPRQRAAIIDGIALALTTSESSLSQRVWKGTVTPEDIVVAFETAPYLSEETNLFCRFVIYSAETEDTRDSVTIFINENTDLVRNIFYQYILAQPGGDVFKTSYPYATRAVTLVPVVRDTTLGVGAIIGISIGGAAVVCLLIGGGYWLYRRNIRTSMKRRKGRVAGVSGRGRGRGRGSARGGSTRGAAAARGSTRGAAGGEGAVVTATPARAAPAPRTRASGRGAGVASAAPGRGSTRARGVTRGARGRVAAA